MKNNSLIKKFLSFSYGSWIGLIIGLISTPIMTRILTPEDFGKASMFTLAINVLMILVIFGTDQSFVRFFYEEEESKRGGLLYNCLKIPTIFLIIVSLSLILFYKKVSLFLFDDINFSIIIVLVIGLIMQVYNRYTSLVIRMQQKGNKFSIIEILNKLLNLIFMIILFFFIGKKYTIIVYSYVSTMMVLTFISLIWEKKIWNLSNLKIKDFQHSKKDIIIYAYPLVFTLLITWLFQGFDRIAIKQWSTLRELGMYSAAYKIAGILGIIQTSFTTFWTPVAYENYEKSPNNKAFFEKISKLIQFLMLIIAVFSIMFKKVVVLILGAEYTDAFYIMPFLVIVPVMYTISETTVLGINFYKKPKWHMLISVVACLTNILGNWILVPKYGAVGAGISTAISYVVFFSMRTYISFLYYKLEIKIIRLYFSICFIFLYSFITFFIQNEVVLFAIGIVLLIFIFVLYMKDLFEMKNTIKNRNL